MVEIDINDDMILAKGHAESKPICGLFSGICAFVQIGLEGTREGDAVSLNQGHLKVDRHKVVSNEGNHLTNTLIQSLQYLSTEYPKSFKLV